jgi:hypothetical protein
MASSSVSVVLGKLDSSLSRTPSQTQLFEIQKDVYWTVFSLEVSKLE